MPKRHMAKGHETRALPDEAIAMLKADHRKVLHLFRQYDATHDPEMRQRVAADVFAALALLGQLEDAVFYPAFAETGEEGERLVEGARQEHQLFKDLMAELRDIDDDDEFPARFHALRDYVEQHVEDEEREMFPQAEVHLADKMAHSTDAMQEWKHQLVASYTGVST
jgi:hypothetical protein